MCLFLFSALFRRRPVEVEAAHVRGDGSGAELSQHRGDLAAMVRPVVDHVLQALNEQETQAIPGEIPVVERLLQALAGN
jgi:hypothetical protein